MEIHGIENNAALHIAVEIDMHAKIVPFKDIFVTIDAFDYHYKVEKYFLY